MLQQIAKTSLEEHFIRTRLILIHAMQVTVYYRSPHHGWYRDQYEGRSNGQEWKSNTRSVRSGRDHRRYPWNNRLDGNELADSNLFGKMAGENAAMNK